MALLSFQMSYSGGTAKKVVIWMHRNKQRTNLFLQCHTMKCDRKCNRIGVGMWFCLYFKKVSDKFFAWDRSPHPFCIFTHLNMKIVYARAPTTEKSRLQLNTAYDCFFSLFFLRYIHKNWVSRASPKLKAYLRTHMI